MYVYLNGVKSTLKWFNKVKFVKIGQMLGPPELFSDPKGLKYHID